MRIDLTRDPDLLAAEVRRLRGAIAAGESEAIAKCDCPGQECQVLSQGNTTPP